MNIPNWISWLLPATKSDVEKIMATQEQLREKVEELQAQVDAEQEQVRVAIEALTTEIQTLRDNAVPDDIVERLEAIKNDLAATIPDAAPEPPVEPTEPGGEEPV